MDLVIVGVKAWQVFGAAEALRPLVGPDTCVPPLQNGVEAPAQLAATLGAPHVLGGVCGIITLVVGPGHIRHGGIDPFVLLSELDNRPSARVERLRETSARAGVKAEVPQDIHAAMWDEAPLRRGHDRDRRRDPRAGWRLARRASMPPDRRGRRGGVAAVARARAVELPPNAVPSTLATLDGLAASATTSLQRDILEGTPRSSRHRSAPSSGWAARWVSPPRFTRFSTPAPFPRSTARGERAPPG